MPFCPVRGHWCACSGPTCPEDATTWVCNSALTPSQGDAVTKARLLYAMKTGHAPEDPPRKKGRK